MQCGLEIESPVSWDLYFEASMQNTPNPSPSTSLRTNLHRRALRAHLTLQPPGLPPRLHGRRLRLFRLLLTLGRRLLLLPLADRRLSRRGTGFRPLRTTLFDYVEGGADDAALLLDGAAGAFFGDFLSGVEKGGVREMNGIERIKGRRKEDGRTSEMPFLCCLR